MEKLDRDFEQDERKELDDVLDDHSNFKVPDDLQGPEKDESYYDLDYGNTRRISEL